jgi:hypothetical protein
VFGQPPPSQTVTTLFEMPGLPIKASSVGAECPYVRRHNRVRSSCPPERDEVEAERTFIAGRHIAKPQGDF